MGILPVTVVEPQFSNRLARGLVTVDPVIEFQNLGVHSDQLWDQGAN